MSNTVPNILLRGLNLEDILKKYNDGYFNNLIINKININLRVKDIFLTQNLQTNDSKPEDNQCFSIKNRGLELKMLTTNHNEFIGANSDSGEKICMRCCRKFNHSKASIIVDSKIEIYLRGENYIPIHKYYSIMTFCTYNCVFEKLKKDLKSVSSGYETEKAFSLTKEVFFKLYPKETEVPIAHDPSLLDINGGPLCLSQFFSNEYKYFKLKGLYIYPCKEVFMQFDN